MSKKRKNLFDVVSKKTSSHSTGSWGPVKPRCYETHKPLKIKVGDKEYEIYGGSCSTPAVKDADVYIGFDYGMKFTDRHWPWKKGAEVYFEVNDMRAPKRPEEFKKLIAWTIKQLEAGKKVHAGCIGGHGRTGLFLSALVKEMTGEVQAIEYVRKHYCPKVVESREQVDFLHEHFGISKANSSKGGGHTYGKAHKDYDDHFDGYGGGKSVTTYSNPSTKVVAGTAKIMDVHPVPKVSIWDDPEAA